MFDSGEFRSFNIFFQFLRRVVYYPDIFIDVVELKQKTLEPIAEPKEIPPQVKILVDTFKGTILNK